MIRKSGKHLLAAESNLQGLKAFCAMLLIMIELTVKTLYVWIKKADSTELHKMVDGHLKDSYFIVTLGQDMSKDTSILAKYHEDPWSHLIGISRQMCGTKVPTEVRLR